MGKLPWPQHNPSFSKTQYDSMMTNLWIINNFGQYQGGETKESMYFHNGLDIVLPNGTPLFAVDSGTVRAIEGTDPSYSWIVIEDSDRPGYGWLYAHVYYFKVEVGDHVPQGTYVADVNFVVGLGHVHFSRVCLEPGGSWDSSYDMYRIQPDDYFTYTDTQPPVFEGFLFYFHNNSDSLFQKEVQTTIWGDVDIVIGIREEGEYSQSYNREGRLCITRIEYEISGEQISTVHKKSFDFSKLILQRLPGSEEMLVSTVYKFWHLIGTELSPYWFYSYYVITNCDGMGEFGLVDPADQNYAWNTAAKDSNGDPLFPDGEYLLTVTAYDFNGNHSSISETVHLANAQHSPRQ